MKEVDRLVRPEDVKDGKEWLVLTRPEKAVLFDLDEITERQMRYVAAQKRHRPSSTTVEKLTSKQLVNRLGPGNYGFANSKEYNATEIHDLVRDTFEKDLEEILEEHDG